MTGGASKELEDSSKLHVNTHHKTKMLYSDPDKMLFREEISSLLQNDVIKQVSSLEQGHVSSIFLREKKDKTHRLILKYFN